MLPEKLYFDIFYSLMRPPELHQDPYPVYRRLRDEFPLHYNPELRFWTLSRYQDVFAALNDPELYCSGQGIAVGIPETAGAGFGSGTAAGCGTTAFGCGTGAGDNTGNQQS